MNRVPNNYYFPNTNADYEFGFTFGTHNAQIKAKILTLLETILNHQTLEDEDCDGGIYSGVGGIAYLFLHLIRSADGLDGILTAAERVKIVPVIQKFLNAQLLYYSKTRAASAVGDDSQKVGFLVGDAGVYAVGAVLAKAIGNKELQFQCVSEFTAAAEIAKRLNFHKHGSDELFYGRAGYLTGALWLNQYLGYQPVPQNDLFAIWKLIVEHGRDTAKRMKSNRLCPLAYTFCGKQFLGAGHGLSSILQVLLSWPQFLTLDPKAEGDIRKTLDYFVKSIFQDYGVTFAPCIMDEVKLKIETQKSGEESLERAHRNGFAQWCYGAPGFVYLLAKAGLHYKSHEYLKGCLKCADLVWNYGLVKKGPGLCHGIAGNGYVFLLLYRLTENDPKYLYRALRFAEFIFSPEFRKDSEIPDHPYSLFEGLAGAICFLSDVIRPSTAEFPFFNVFYEPGLTTIPPIPLAIPNIGTELVSQLQIKHNCVEINTLIKNQAKIAAKIEANDVTGDTSNEESELFSNPNGFDEEDSTEYYGGDLGVNASSVLEMEMKIKEEPIEVDQNSWGCPGVQEAESV